MLVEPTGASILCFECVETGGRKSRRRQMKPVLSSTDRQSESVILNEEHPKDGLGSDDLLRI